MTQQINTSSSDFTVNLSKLTTDQSTSTPIQYNNMSDNITQSNDVDNEIYHKKHCKKNSMKLIIDFFNNYFIFIILISIMLFMFYYICNKNT